eukprot:5744888-Pleurochrysis_carterae.AAC.2
MAILIAKASAESEPLPSATCRSCRPSAAENPQSLLRCAKNLYALRCSAQFVDATDELCRPEWSSQGRGVGGVGVGVGLAPHARFVAGRLVPHVPEPRRDRASLALAVEMVDPATETPPAAAAAAMKAQTGQADGEQGHKTHDGLNLNGQEQVFGLWHVLRAQLEACALFIAALAAGSLLQGCADMELFGLNAIVIGPQGGAAAMDMVTYFSSYTPRGSELIPKPAGLARMRSPQNALILCAARGQRSPTSFASLPRPVVRAPDSWRRRASWRFDPKAKRRARLAACAAWTARYAAALVGKPAGALAAAAR